MNPNNPFLNDDDPFQNDSSLDTNPFIDPSILKHDTKEENNVEPKKNNSDEEKVVTISLKDIQRMNFPDNNVNPNLMNPTTTPPNNDNESFDEAVNRSLDWMHSVKTTFLKFKRVIELLIIIGLIAFGTIQYRSYSKKANQVLFYQYGSESYEIERNQYKFHIIHRREVCEEECNTILVGEYDSSLSSFQSIIASIYFDFSFQFHNGSKKINGKKLNSSISSKTIYSLIHNDPLFLSFNKNQGYSIVDYEQLSDYKIRGFSYEEKEGHFYVAISLGIKESTGYEIKVYEVHEKDGNFNIYVSETIPKTESKWINENSPTVIVELNHNPNIIRVFEVKSGEEFISYDLIG